jgi:hypothetical protein
LRRPTRSEPCAASWLVRDAINGPVREFLVVAASPHAVYAVYAEAADPARSPEFPGVIAMGSANALALPFMMRCAAPIDQTPLARVTPGATITCGAGVVVVDDVALVPRRWWEPPRVRPRPAPDVRTVAALDALVAARAIGDGELLRAAATRLSYGTVDAGAVRALLGRGPGLTPSGDDVICGVLLGLRAFGGSSAAHAELAQTVAAMSGRRTTAVSAALIRCAVDGYALPAVIDLVESVQAGDMAALPARCATVFAIGHESGAALVVGLAAAARAAVKGAVAA